MWYQHLWEELESRQQVTLMALMALESVIGQSS